METANLIFCQFPAYTCSARVETLGMGGPPVNFLQIIPSDMDRHKPAGKGQWLCWHALNTVELLITDPPRSDHPPYNGQPLWNGLNLP